MKMGLEKIVEEIVDSNRWLNGWYDYRDGDIMALVNQPEKFIGLPKEHTNLIELFTDLKNYDGTFKYKNLLFFKDWRYGVFVYDIENPKDYIEHLTIDVMTSETFQTIIANLTTKGEHKYIINARGELYCLKHRETYPCSEY